MNSVNAVTVILVEDERMVRKMLERALAALGCEVLGIADDGQTGISLFKDVRPDLVLMDIRMPNTNLQKQSLMGPIA